MLACPSMSFGPHKKRQLKHRSACKAASSAVHIRHLHCGRPRRNLLSQIGERRSPTNCRDVSKGFNATLGYPGEGPSMSRAAPVTPPKVSGPKITESRRILVPPPKTSKAAGPVPHCRARQPPEPPVPRAKAKVSNAGVSRAITIGPKAGTVGPTPPPPPKARRAPQELNRVVKPKFDTGFRYPVSPKIEEVPTNSPSFSGIRLSLQDNPDLPGIRPSMPLNLDRRLPVEEVIDGSRVAKRKSEAPVTGESTIASEPRFVRPTPKVKRPQDIPSESTGNPLQGKGGSETLPKSEPSPVSGHESTGKPASSGSTRVEAKGEQDAADIRLDPSHAGDRAPSSGELTSSSSDLEVRTINDDREKGLPGGDVTPRIHSPQPAFPKVPPPLDPRPDQAPEARGPASGVQGEGRVTGVERREPDNVGLRDRISYEVTIQVLANPEDRRTRLLTLSSTHAGLYCNRLVVHGTRRVLEVLLMAWRSGYRLGEMTRYVRLGEEDGLRMPVSVRDLFDRVVVGSTILARFVTDTQGAMVQIRYGLLKSLLEHPQTLEAECHRCDPLRPAQLVSDQEDDTTGCVFSLRLEARQHPVKTFVHDALQACSSQEHPAVSLCQTLTHWMRVPGVHRIRPGWGLLVWPVPLRELQQRDGP